MTIRRKQLVLVLTAAAAAFSPSAHAADVTLAADQQWSEFTVDNLAGPSFDSRWIDFTDGSTLSFSFTIDAGMVGTLTVVDAGFAGDTFSITDFGSALAETSAVPVGTTAGDVAASLDAALADSSYSRGVYTLGAGTHRITGRLEQSVTDGGVPLFATDGAVRLAVAAAVPEPSTYAFLLAGLGAVGFVAARRR